MFENEAPSLASASTARFGISVTFVSALSMEADTSSRTVRIATSSARDFALRSDSTFAVFVASRTV